LGMLGPGINRVRVLPRRFVSGGDPDRGPGGGWARLVTRHAGAMAGIGLLIVAILLVPASRLNPGDALAKSEPGSGPAITGREALPAFAHGLGTGAQLRVAGTAPQSRDFSRSVYGNFPYMLAFVVVLTYILLARAFRSLILPLKAVLLNLVSLGAAYGIVVFVFQQGHGSETIWSVPGTGVVISWIPLMIFAFLYGISMDYEVFMLTRMREVYDETGDTHRAIELGLERTGKLVTSAALVLMFAFIVLSSSPGADIKQFGIGLAAG